MIRKFEDNDIDDIIQIWKSANIKAHNFIYFFKFGIINVRTCPLSL